MTTVSGSSSAAKPMAILRLWPSANPHPTDLFLAQADDVRPRADWPKAMEVSTGLVCPTSGWKKAVPEMTTWARVVILKSCGTYSNPDVKLGLKQLHPSSGDAVSCDASQYNGSEQSVAGEIAAVAAAGHTAGCAATCV